MPDQSGRSGMYVVCKCLTTSGAWNGLVMLTSRSMVLLTSASILLKCRPKGVESLRAPPSGGSLPSTSESSSVTLSLFFFASSARSSTVACDSASRHRSLKVSVASSSVVDAASFERSHMYPFRTSFLFTCCFSSDEKFFVRCAVHMARHVAFFPSDGASLWL